MLPGVIEPEDRKGLQGPSLDFPGLSLQSYYPLVICPPEIGGEPPIQASDFQFSGMWAISLKCETHIFKFLITILKKRKWNRRDYEKSILFNPNI